MNMHVNPHELIVIQMEQLVYHAPLAAGSKNITCTYSNNKVRFYVWIFDTCVVGRDLMDSNKTQSKL